MNKYIAYNNTTGLILYTASYEDDTIIPETVDTTSFLKVDLNTDDNLLLKSYIKNSELKTLPLKPEYPVIFNLELEIWEPDVPAANNSVITKRNRLLQQSDWTQLPDVPLVTKDAWTTYRQALRDITTQPGFPLDVVWPIPPNN